MNLLKFVVGWLAVTAVGASAYFVILTLCTPRHLSFKPYFISAVVSLGVAVILLVVFDWLYRRTHDPRE